MTYRWYATNLVVLTGLAFLIGHGAADEPKTTVTPLAETGPAVLGTTPTTLPLKPVAGQDKSKDSLPQPKADVTPVPLSIGGNLKYEPYKIVRLAAQGVPDKAGKKWKVEPLTDPKSEVDWATGRNVIRPEWVAPPGRYRVTLSVAWADQAGQFYLDDTEVEVLIGPAPPVPVPPTPTPPGPTPPGPTPPTPTPGGPLRVIFTYERQQPMTREQEAIFNSTRIREYLNRKANKGPDGRPEYRHWDDDVTFGPTRPETAVMQTLWSSVKPKLANDTPQVAIGSGTVVDVYPITPTDTEDTVLALLKKYGGE